MLAFCNGLNFYVLTEENLDVQALTSFLEKAYCPIDPNIIHAYSFTAWATSILELDE